MDVNKDPPLQAVTHPSTTAAQWEMEKETGNGQKPKRLWGTLGGAPQMAQVVVGLNKCVFTRSRSTLHLL